MRKQNSLPVFIFTVIFVVGLLITYGVFRNSGIVKIAVSGIISFLIALAISIAIKVADQWEKAVVLRLGKFHALSGPGLFFIIPIVDSVAYWIDVRVITTPFKAEKTLTKDTVPVDVDAILFWKVVNSEKAALEVSDYQSAITWASQTALRDVIGKTMLADMLEGREKIDIELQKIIDKRASPWGITVISVEIRDVLIPIALQKAMSMQAQAERERQARVILGDSERQIAQKFVEAAKTYAEYPTALHLRAMNMLYEGLKEKASLIIVPSTAVNTMQLGSIAGLAALQKEMQQQELEQEAKQSKTEGEAEKTEEPPAS